MQYEMQYSLPETVQPGPIQYKQYSEQSARLCRFFNVPCGQFGT